MQNSRTNTDAETSSKSDIDVVPGRVLALDLGTRRVGVAISDELQMTVRPLPPLIRSNWKQLVHDLTAICRQFDVKMVVLGLPVRPSEIEGNADLNVDRTAEKLRLTLGLPVYLQDESYTSVDAETRLRAASLTSREVEDKLDSEAAALILNDFISGEPQAD